jgi:hypothetical protein
MGNLVFSSKFKVQGSAFPLQACAGFWFQAQGMTVRFAQQSGVLTLNLELRTSNLQL